VAFGARFLVDPVGFAMADADGAADDASLTLRFAGGRYCIDGLSRAQAQSVRERFGALAAGPPRENELPLHELRVRAADARCFLPAPATKPWEYTFDQDATVEGVRLAGVGFAARLDLAGAARMTLWTAAPLAELPGLVENALRVLAAYVLASQGGLLLHSAGVGARHGALVFFGPSGAGKTTVARHALAAGRRVLSDDLNAIVVGAAGSSVEQVPFAGDLGGGHAATLSPASLPLRALCRLRQGSGVAATRITPAHALAGLLAASPFLNADRFRAAQLERHLLALAKRVPVLELTFARDSPFTGIEEVVEAMLASAPAAASPR
jgi:hypothetical protein